MDIRKQRFYIKRRRTDRVERFVIVDRQSDIDRFYSSLEIIELKACPEYQLPAYQSTLVKGDFLSHSSSKSEKRTHLRYSFLNWHAHVIKCRYPRNGISSHEKMLLMGFRQRYNHPYSIFFLFSFFFFFYLIPPGTPNKCFFRPLLS